MKKHLILWIVLIAAYVSFMVYMSRPAQSVQAQGGFVSIGTYSQQVIVNAVTLGATHVTPVTGTSPAGGTGASLVAIGNSGQSSHWLMYCVTAGVLTLQLEGSGDSNTWTQISEQGQLTAAGCGVLEAAGYYNYIRVNILALNASGGVANAWYSATGNAIPGSGITASGKSSQPVTFVPGLTFSNTNLKSTVANISTTPVSITEMSVSNPNASAVFLIVNGTTPSTSMAYQVAANGSRDVPFPVGVQTIGTSSVACATAVGGAGDPATGCVVNIVYKNVTSVSSSVSSTGAGQASSTTVPR